MLEGNGKKVLVEMTEVTELTEKEKRGGMQIIDGVKKLQCAKTKEWLTLNHFHRDKKSDSGYKKISKEVANKMKTDKRKLLVEKAAIQDAIDLLETKGYSVTKER